MVIHFFWPEEKKEKGPSKEYWRGFRSQSSQEIEEGELLRGEVGPNIAPMEEEIGGEEGGDEEEGWVMGPNILPMERGGEERGGEDEEVGTDEEEAEPLGQHTRFGPRWANFVRNLIE